MTQTSEKGGVNLGWFAGLARKHGHHDQADWIDAHMSALSTPAESSGTGGEAVSAIQVREYAEAGEGDPVSRDLKRVHRSGALAKHPDALKHLWAARFAVAGQVLSRPIENKQAAALGAINGIRNSIIGCQTVNFSEHVYPLVAALGEAGYAGLEYAEARENVGTLIERANAAEAELAALKGTHPLAVNGVGGPAGDYADTGKAGGGEVRTEYDIRLAHHVEWIRKASVIGGAGWDDGKCPLIVSSLFHLAQDAIRDLQALTSEPQS